MPLRGTADRWPCRGVWGTRPPKFSSHALPSQGRGLGGGVFSERHPLDTLTAQQSADLPHMLLLVNDQIDREP